MLKAVIFDMDGVISDTEPVYEISSIQFLRHLGIHVDSTYLSQFIGTTNEFMWTTIMKDFGFDLSVDECVDGVDQIRKEYEKKHGLQAIPGVIDLIKRLKQADLSLAVASSSSMKEIKRVLDILNIRSYFHTIVSGTECEHSKPFPDVFLKAAKALNVKVSECVVIEDAKNGVLAANRANIKSIGFDNPNFGNQDLSLANLIVTDFSEVTVDVCKELLES